MKDLTLFLIIRKLSKNLSVRAAFFAIVAVILALTTNWLSRFVPDELAHLFGGDASREVLDILAKSMLVVVTFSMSTLVATYSMITGSSTPRATKLIMEDSSAHNALSTFLGAFIFSLVSLIFLSTEMYGAKGRVVLFIVTILLTAIVIMTIIRWIGRLSNLGHLENLIKEIVFMIDSSVKNNCLAFEWQPRESFNETDFDKDINYNIQDYGFIQSIDFDFLEECSKKYNLKISLAINVGDLITTGTLIGKLHYKGSVNSELISNINSCIHLGEARVFDEDFRYGVTALSELASRALSPGINDPGTAVQIVASISRLLFSLTKLENIKESNIYKKPITASEIFDIAFTPIARDGRDNIEVQKSLIENFKLLSTFRIYQAISEEYSNMTIARAKDGLNFNPDYERLKKVL